MVGILVILFFLNLSHNGKSHYNNNKTISLINVFQINMLSFGIENIEVEELL